MSSRRPGVYKALTFAVTLALVLGAVVGCERAGEGDDRAEGERAGAQTSEAAAPNVALQPDLQGVSLRYFSPTTGKLVFAAGRADVPEAARRQVIVTPDDPAKRGPWLFVADLSGDADSEAGSAWPVERVNRHELERARAAAEPADNAKGAPAEGAVAAMGAKAAAAAGAGSDAEVILYKTSWCGYCKKAARYLKAKGVAVIERDLERDAGARADMLARARRAGVPPSRLQGVPILWIRGQILAGFDRGAIDRALGG